MCDIFQLTVIYKGKFACRPLCKPFINLFIFYAILSSVHMETFVIDPTKSFINEAPDVSLANCNAD